MTSLLFSDVTDAKLANVDKLLANLGMARPDSDTGEATGDGMVFGYTIDRSAGTLALEIKSAPEWLTAEHVQHRVRAALDDAVTGEVSDKCGVYNYVRVYVKNRSGSSLKATGNYKIDLGSVDVENATIDNDNSEVENEQYGVDAYAQVFECRSGAASGIGCKGVVSMAFDDGITLLNITYELNGIGNATFTSGISGPSSRYYTRTDIDYWKHLHDDGSSTEKPKAHVDGYTYILALIEVDEA